MKGCMTAREEVGVTEGLCQFLYTRRGWLRDKKDDVFPGDLRRKALLLASFKKECQFCSLEFCCFLSSFFKNRQNQSLLTLNQAFKYRSMHLEQQEQAFHLLEKADVTKERSTHKAHQAEATQVKGITGFWVGFWGGFCYGVRQTSYN